MKARVGIDLGGTKIEAVALDQDGEELTRLRVPTPQGDYDGTVRAVRDLIAQVSAGLDTFDVVGLGTPGAISPFDGLMKNANSVILNGRPFDRDLAEAVGRPLLMRNDADCFALSEAVDGAGAEAEVVFGVILGTGVGGGLVVDRVVRTGPNRIAGEWGHNPLPWPAEDERPGLECYCGKQGCVEQWVSGPGMAADDKRMNAARRTTAEIVQASRQGDPGARATLNRYVDRLARALAVVVNIVDPDVVVLGGGMSNIDELYREIPAVWDRYVFGGEVGTRLLKNRHGDSSGVRGAAMLVPA